MRMLMKVCMNTETTNRAVRDNTLQTTIMSVADMLKPEAMYFLPENGRRTGYFFFDMTDSSLMPQISEQLFMEFGAEIYFYPVMNKEDLQKGLQNAMNTRKK
ncbi:MAG: hypothetical protein HF300_18590 [Ignavibacteria bacterium]|nr:hypothetical protein [Ignavibacteria bacterium]MCU7498901.1 hypothetical protein [Ignavibacteria bacterium]MCU7514575.1 hypothetical protein [Ignavibacteria bacterium]MCU7521346.1 hypothetical protein [Ignavibacteria bacterium]MCU7524208.1 hypothetical protein [Ignavibacteria bacterium]